jgi:hypothetical protein
MGSLRSLLARSLVATLGLAALLGPRTARAFCREVTETPPTGFNPVMVGSCFTTDPEAGALLPQLFWRNQCVNFNLNINASPLRNISLNEARSIASQAFSTWTTASCPGGGAPSILATEGPPVSCNGQSQAHNNPIIFRDTGWTYIDSANAIGYTTLTVDLDTGEILGAEIEINTEFQSIVTTSPPPSGSFDLQSILTHEAGHFLGLAHSGDMNAVMYAFYHSGSAALQPDDVAGICSAYAPDGTRNTNAGPMAATACQFSPILGYEYICGSIDAGAFTGAGGTSDPDGGVGPLNETLFGCSIGHASGQHVPGSAEAGSEPDRDARGLVASGLFALAVVGRRKLRRRGT